MRVLWAPQARTAFRSHVAYLAELNPKAARRCRNAIHSTAMTLADMPLRHRDRGGGLRQIPVLATPYLIVYRVEGASVRILAVRHGHQDDS